jgi:hypothetical protein
VGNKTGKSGNSLKRQNDAVSIVGDTGGNNEGITGPSFPDILQFIGTILVTAGDVITVFGQTLAFEQERQDQIQSLQEKQEQQRQQQEMQNQIDEMQDQINQLLKQLEKQPSRNGKNQRT